MAQAVVLFVVVGLAAFGVEVYQTALGPVSPGSERAVTVAIPEGASTRAIALELRERGLVRVPLAFRAAARLLGADGRLQAGEYALGFGMSVPEIIKKLKAGDVVPVRFTIPEGFTIRQIADLLGAKGLASSRRFLNLAQGKDQSFQIVVAGEKFTGPLEGYLFPDTYEVWKGESEEDLIRMMVARFEEVVLPRYRAAGAGRPLGQVVTMASLVEREAKLDSERPIVAGVFYNRLERHMPLQSCATVQYALGHTKEKLTYDDLKIKSPYNTYLNPGLPPGPIANPGLRSIEAALKPATTKYLYFVAKNDGSHAFAATLREHEANKRRFQD